MIVAYDSTVSLSYLIDVLNDFPPPIVAEENLPRNKVVASTRTYGGYLQLLPNVESFQLRRGSAGPFNIQHRFGEQVGITGTLDLGDVNVADVVSSKRDPWVVATVEAISAHRGLIAGWDNAVADVPTEESLDTAELLTHGFALAPMNKRPQFMVDTEGNPSFTIYNDDVYLHLTIDGGRSISWFRTAADGTEEFEDGVVVTPENVREIAQRILAVEV